MAGRLCLAAVVAAGLGLAACGSSSSTGSRSATTTNGLQLVGTPVVLSADYPLPNNVTGWATAVVAYVRNGGNAAVDHASFRATVLSSSGRTAAVSDPEGFSILPGVTRPVVWTTDTPQGEQPASATVTLSPATSQRPGYPPSDQLFWSIADKNLDCSRQSVECAATATITWNGALPQSASAAVTVVVHQGNNPKGKVIAAGARPLISTSGGTAQPARPIPWTDDTVVIDKQDRPPATPTNAEYWVDSFDTLSNQ